MFKQILVVLLLLIVSLALNAQQLGILRGVVTDESGALVPGAKVVVSDGARPVKSVIAGNDGSYSIAGIPPGKYTVQLRDGAYERRASKSRSPNNRASDEVSTVGGALQSAFSNMWIH